MENYHKHCVSGVMLVHNNARTIRQCVSSLKGLIDELIIIDDHSTDTTIEIIRSIFPEVRVVQKKLERFDVQRNFGIEMVKNGWILMIDSDEEISRELSTLIREEMQAPHFERYTCYRENWSFGTSTVLTLERPILFVRGMQFVGALHEVPTTQEKTGFFNAKLIHHSWIDAADWMDDLNHYSTHQAKKWIIQGRRYSTIQLIAIAFGMPLYHFMGMYIGQRRFRNGLFAGLLYSIACSLEWLFVVLKYYELRKNAHQEPVRSIK